MTWIDFKRFGQRENLLLQTLVKQSGPFFSVARQIRSTNRPNEESISCEHEPRFGSSGFICH